MTLDCAVRRTTSGRLYRSSEAVTSSFASGSAYDEQDGTRRQRCLLTVHHSGSDAKCPYFQRSRPAAKLATREPQRLR